MRITPEAIKDQTKLHYLKCEQKYFRQLAKGEKRFEIRKNDRPGGFRKNDTLWLSEVINLGMDDHGSDRVYSCGNHLTVKVLNVLEKHDGLRDGYVIMTVELLDYSIYPSSV